MNNVLIISPFCPYPLTSGGHQAIYNGIAILEDVTNVYVSFKTTESKCKHGQCKALRQALPFVHVVPYIDPDSRHTFGWYRKVLLNKLLSTLHRSTNSSNDTTFTDNPPSLVDGIYDIPQDEVNFILKVIRKYKINIVQVEMTPYLSVVKYLTGNHLKKIFVHHELNYVRNELLLKTSEGVTTEDWKHWEENKKKETELLNQYDEVVTLSDTDTNKLIEAGVKTRIITSFAIVTGDVKPFVQEKQTRKILSFVGPEYHYPNYDGIIWFLQNCWNKLRNQYPEFSFQIIGHWSDTTAKFISSTYENVQCVGFVDNLAEALSGTTMIVPLNIGSGIRMKILEAARLGVPVVSTPVGAEGLPLKNGESIFITADADKFVADIINLQDESLRKKFVENTCESIKEKYSLEALKQNRVALYQ